jgi:tRNA-dihydrouridine synthase B
MNNFWQKLSKKGPILALAPMAGITDSAYRLVCKQNGADVVYSEMTSIDALAYNSKKTFEMLKYDKKEKPVVLQLFGKRPEKVRRAVEIVESAGFDGIDLNFGCPARKVVNHGGGITLLRDLDLCYELVQAVCEATKLPVSVKTRVSLDNKKITVYDFIDKIRELPVSALMLHGRTYEQKFTGDIDFQTMKAVKRKFNGIVIGNGGVNTPEDAKHMIDATGVDGIGLARGIYGKPWLFSQIKDYLKNGICEFPDINTIKKIVLAHAKAAHNMKGKFGIIEMRKHLCWYFKGLPNANALRKDFVQITTINDIKTAFKKF